MVLQSRQFDLYRKLGIKLLIEDESAQGIPPLVNRSVTPIIDVSRLLITEDAATSSQDLSGGGSASIAYHTVPDGERWHLRWFVREAAVVATHIELRKVVANISFQITANQAALQFGTFEGIVLDEGDTVNLIETGDAGDTAIFCHIMFGREELG